MHEKIITDFHRACRNITTCAGNKALNYAVGYAEAGLALREPKAIQVQCLYILNNISSWRGPIAKETRETLRELTRNSTWKVDA